MKRIIEVLIGLIVFPITYATCQISDTERLSHNVFDDAAPVTYDIISTMLDKAANAPFERKNCFRPFKFTQSKEKVEQIISENIKGGKYRRFKGDLYEVALKFDEEIGYVVLGNFQYRDDKLCQMLVMVERKYAKFFQRYLTYKEYLVFNKWRWTLMGENMVYFYIRENKVVERIDIDDGEYEIYYFSDYPKAKDIEIKLNYDADGE